MKTIKFLLAAFILSLTLSSCSKQNDDDESAATTPIVTNPTAPTYYIEVNTINQLMYSTKANPIPGDYSSLDGKTIKTTTTKPLNYVAYMQIGTHTNPNLVITYWTDTTPKKMIIYGTIPPHITKIEGAIELPALKTSDTPSNPKTGTFNW